MSPPSAASATARPAMARFNELVSYQKQHLENGIPQEVLEYLAANKVFPVVSPEGLVGRNALAPLRSRPGLCLTIAQCTPNQGPVLHNHTGTLETFFCLDGRFDVLWGNELEHKVTLEPGSLCSVPPNVYRAFRNLVDTEARLLVLIQGDEKMNDKIEMPRRIGTEILEKHGQIVVEKLAAINMRFEGDPADDVSDERMKSRTAHIDALAAREVNGETVYPLMGTRSDLQAPVQCWPGMEVAMLNLDAQAASTTTVDETNWQWVINTGGEICEIDVEGEKTQLNRYDFIRVEPGKRRTIRNTSTNPNRVMLVNQGPTPISAEAITAFKAAQAAN